MIAESEKEFFVITEFTDIEIVRSDAHYIYAIGTRFGRKWLLKGVLPELCDTSVGRERLLMEFGTLSGILDSGAIRVVGIEHVASLGMCIVEEFIEGSSLERCINEKALNKREREMIMRDIIRIVGVLHEEGIVLNRLDPSAIIIRGEKAGVTLVDFSCAERFEDNTSEDMQKGISRDIYALGNIMRTFCPEWNGIAKKCLGPAERRPKRADDISKMFKRKERVRKRAVGFTAAAVIMGIAMTVMSYMQELEVKASEASATVQSIAKEIEVQRQEIAWLTDSLTTISEKNKAIRSKIKDKERSEAAKIKIKEEMQRKLNAIYEYNDKHVIPLMTHAGTEYIAKNTDLARKALVIRHEATNPQTYPELSESERILLQEDLYKVYEETHMRFLQKWHAELKRKKETKTTEVQSEENSLD